MYNKQKMSNTLYNIGLLVLTAKVKSKDAVFVIDADYSLFEDGGKVYIDDILIDSCNYKSEKGSTKIIFKKSFLDSLSAGEHILKVVFNNGSVPETLFTISSNDTKNADTRYNDSSNPSTGDNILLYVSLMIISLVGFLTSKLYLKKVISN